MPEKENRVRKIHIGSDSVIADLDANGNVVKPAETKGPKIHPETGAYEPAMYPVKARSTWETGKPVPVTLTRIDK